MPEKLHPFIPVEAVKFPASVLIRGLEVGGGMKLLQYYYYFSKAFCTASYHGTTMEHLSEEKFCCIKLNEFLFLLSVLILIKGPHMAIPALKNAFRKELWSKLLGWTEKWRLHAGPIHCCIAVHLGCALVKDWGEQSAAGRLRFQFCSTLHVLSCIAWSVKFYLYECSLL